MFQFFFKYPEPVFSKGRFVLLSTWPAWLLPVLIVAAAAFLALLLRWRLSEAAPVLKSWRAIILWALQAGLVALLLIALWQPAMSVAELSSQQNIIAVVVDDSRSMSLRDDNRTTREETAVAALQGGLLSGLQQRFQTRLYTIGRELRRTDSINQITPAEPATHLDAGLKQLISDTSDLPLGAVLLLSDGGQNDLGLGPSSVGSDVLQELHNRRLPVHTVGFGDPVPAHDIEIEDVSVAPSAVANSRTAATVTLTQHGYIGQKARLAVRYGDKTLAEREISLLPDGRLQSEQIFFPVGAAGVRSLSFDVAPLPGEGNLANNSVTRPLLVSESKRRILYIEGEPRWEYKFIRRAEDQDPTVQVVSMLRTSENKIYRQGLSNPEELAQGFPVRAEDLFNYSGIIIGSVAAGAFCFSAGTLLSVTEDGVRRA